MPGRGSVSASTCLCSGTGATIFAGGKGDFGFGAARETHRVRQAVTDRQTGRQTGRQADRGGRVSESEAAGTVL